MAQESYKREQEAGCQPPDGPIRCAKNCGFFGSAATLNMCSKCYRDHVLQQTKEAAKASSAAAVKASHQAASRADLMDIDSDGNMNGTDNDFMSGVKVLAGMAAEDKTTSSGSMLAGGKSASAVASSSFASSSAETSSAAAATAATLPFSTSASPFVGTQTSSSPQPAAPRGPNRCAACKKKVGLTGFKCRCNNVFCSTHRYSDKHDCTFDYKAAARDAIAKANPVVRGTKIEKI